MFCVSKQKDSTADSCNLEETIGDKSKTCQSVKSVESSGDDVVKLPE